MIITLADGLRGGSHETAQHAREAGKRCIQLSQADRFDSSAALRGFAKAEAVRILNVGGSREGEEPGSTNSLKRFCAGLSRTKPETQISSQRATTLSLFGRTTGEFSSLSLHSRPMVLFLDD